jgi:hypothetical protein
MDALLLAALTKLEIKKRVAVNRESTAMWRFSSGRLGPANVEDNIPRKCVNLWSGERHFRD